MSSAAHHPHDTRRVSDLLAGLAREQNGDTIKLARLLEVIGDRAFGLLILVFALPNAIGLGTIPGLSTVFGVPQLVVALQMAIGMERPWLPQFLLERGIARKDLATMVERAGPYLERAERVLKPRWLPLSEFWAERFIGVVFAVLAAIVSLPIPFGNWPPAVAMAVTSLGLIERDGVYISLGLALSVVAVVVAGGVVAAGAAAIFYLFRLVFGG